jgi:hypothetical protein
MIYDRIWEKYDRLRFPYFTVFRRIRPRAYTIVILSHVVWRNTVVYDTVYDRLRPYTKTVIVDLGDDMLCAILHYLVGRLRNHVIIVKSVSKMLNNDDESDGT